MPLPLARINNDASTEQRQPVQSRRTNAQVDALMGSRLEVLRVLALALLNEIDALSQATIEEAEAPRSIADEVKRFEAELIRCALVHTGGQLRRAARLLGVKVTTLHAKLKRYDIDLSEISNSARRGRIGEKRSALTMRVPTMNTRMPGIKGW